jgi:S1-C subfamily serine protease
MVLSADGEILTNNHVVAGADQIQITVTATGETYDAAVVGTDPTNDVAVVRASGASGLATIPLGNSDNVHEGDPIVAIGNAGGQGGTPSAVAGAVTALHQQITASDENGASAETLSDTIEINANIQPGDSGGPLVDANAKVVGMNSAAAAANGRRRGTTNDGYAIPINKALSIARTIEANPDPATAPTAGAHKALLGVQVDTSTSPGAAVVSVQANSPAAAAGLAAGDLIIGLDRTAIGSANDLSAALQSHQPGDTVTVTWQGADGVHRQAITLATR